MSAKVNNGVVVKKSLWVIAGVALLAVAAYGAWHFSGGGVVTADNIFKDMVAKLERERKARPWPKEFEKGHSNPYKLLDVKVEDWMATEEGRAAHAIQIPNPVPEDSGYRKGMSQQEYFEHLCKTEAGEFIFKTVDNVEGIFQLRPRKNVYSEEELKHLYAMEDPYGHYTEENENIGFQMVEPLKYTYFEIPVGGARKYGADWRSLLDPSLFIAPPQGASIARYTYIASQTADSHNKRLEYDDKVKSRYGFTWRGIKRPHDRELGIGGGELIVLDLQTNEVMAVRRGYAVWNRGWTYRVCPRYGYFGGEDKGTNFTAWFTMKVAKPPKWKEYFQLLETMRKLPPGAKPYSE
ncbi:MAG: hypothetical protein K8S22_03650 [Betaproteobacteria bacterium]|nr:hypothetical protein [Betaproteobacteria bacterium]